MSLSDSQDFKSSCVFVLCHPSAASYIHDLCFPLPLHIVNEKLRHKSQTTEKNVEELQSNALEFFTYILI